MDDWRTYGPSTGTWITAYDPDTGKAEHVQLCLPILLPSYIVRAARTNEIRLIRGRTKKRFYSLTFMGFPPLIVTEDTLESIGVRFLHATAATPASSHNARSRRVLMPDVALPTSRRMAPQHN